jgi:hypothetical protein
MGSVEGRKGKKRVLSGEDVVYFIYTYEYSIMKSTKQCLEKGKEEGK